MVMNKHRTGRYNLLPLDMWVYRGIIRRRNGKYASLTTEIELMWVDMIALRMQSKP
jgi:hypothetical protein